MIDPVSKENDDERLVDDNIILDAMRINQDEDGNDIFGSSDEISDPVADLIIGRNQRGRRKNNNRLIDSNRKDFDANDDLLKDFLTNRKDRESASKDQDKLAVEDLFDDSPELNSDLKGICDSEGNSSKDKDSEQDTGAKVDVEVEEDCKFYDHSYWSNPYVNTFSVDQILNE
eukprot:scpid99076/ scgid26448/ 